MPKLLPLRVLDEHDVLNFYTYSGNFPVNNGTFVKIVGSGFVNQSLSSMGAVGASYPGVTSNRWTVAPQVAQVSATGDLPIGMLLYDGREVDENGEQLKFRPQKAAEMQAFLSGQAVPIAYKGQFMYSGVSGTPAAGDKAYINVNDGSLTTSVNPNLYIGRFLGAKNSAGWAMVKLDIV